MKKELSIRVLILNGSPRPTGAVTSLLKELSDYLTRSAEVDWVDVYKLNVKPCLGCRSCRKDDGECVQKEDDGHVIGRKLKEAGALIVGTPTHFSNMSAPLKNLLDRNGITLFTEPPSGMPVPKHIGKPAIIGTACMTPLPLSALLGMYSGTIKSVKTYLNYGGYKVLGSLVKTGSVKDATVGPSLLKKAGRLSQKMISAAAKE